MNGDESPRKRGQGCSRPCPSSATCSALGASSRWTADVADPTCSSSISTRRGPAFTADASRWKQHVCVQHLGMIMRMKQCLHPALLLLLRMDSSTDPRSQSSLRTPPTGSAAAEWPGPGPPLTTHRHACSHTGNVGGASP